MALIHKSLKDITQNFSITQENKTKYGEVRTDFKLIESMFHFFLIVYLNNRIKT